MALKKIDVYTREFIRANPDALFAFGDNMIRRGYGGQAAEARDEPNAVGIPTKWSPSRYFSDAAADNRDVRYAIVEAFQVLGDALDSGRDVYWPSAGVGTGLADLANRAPRVMALINQLYSALELKADNQH